MVFREDKGAVRMVRSKHQGFCLVVTPSTAC